MKEHSIKASDAQFIRLFRWIAGLQISSDAKLLFARLLDLADGEQNVKASRRFLRAWLSWSDARLRRASSELERLGWLCRKSSVTPAGDRAATEWKLPRIVIQTSETVRVEGVSYTGHGVPRKDTVSHTGQSRPHKQNTQEGGSRAHARARGGTIAEPTSPALSGAERISLERRLGQIQAELAEACRKKETAAGCGALCRAMPPSFRPWAGQSQGVRNGSMPSRKPLHPTTCRTRNHRRGTNGILRAIQTTS